MFAVEVGERGLLLSEFLVPTEPHRSWLSRLDRALRIAPARLMSLLAISAESGIRPERTALIFLALGIIAALLSFFTDSAVIRVSLLGQNGHAFCREIGYMYDAATGLVSLLFAPLLCWSGLRHIQRCEQKIRDMERDEALYTGSDTAMPRGLPPTTVLAHANRAVFNGFAVAGLLIGSFAFTFCQEYWPGDDRYRLVFGWVQADFVADYGPANKLLTEAIHGRDIYSLDRSDQVILSELDDRQISAFESTGRKLPLDKVRFIGANGPRGARKWLFRLFLIVALTAQALLAFVGFWMFFKFLFVFWVFTIGVANCTGSELAAPAAAFQWVTERAIGGRGVCPFPRPVVHMRVKLLDDKRKFGLKPMIDALSYLRWVIGACAVGVILELIRNASSDYYGIEARFTYRTVLFRGPAGAGWIAAGILLSSIVFLVAIQIKLNRYRKAHMDQYAGAERELLEDQDLNVFMESLKISSFWLGVVGVSNSITKINASTTLSGAKLWADKVSAVAHYLGSRFPCS